MKSRLHDDPWEVARNGAKAFNWVFPLCFFLILVALGNAMLMRGGGDFENSPLNRRTILDIGLVKSRADIHDRNGEVIAKNLPLMSLVADPSKMPDIESAIGKTLSLFPDLNGLWLRQSLQADKRYVLVRSRLTPHEQWLVNNAGIAGYRFDSTEARLYPHKSLFSHAIGFVGRDMQGLEGLERSLDSVITENTDEPLRLSLDSVVQYILRDELSRAIAYYGALGGGGLVMDVRSREILAMVSLPDFDPHVAEHFAKRVLRNKMTREVYEFGSTFKAINSALSLERGRSMMEDYYDASRPLNVGGFLIRDYHAKNRQLNIAEIFIYSSNIGSALMAWESGSSAQRDFFRRLGLLSRIGGEHLSTEKPLYPSVKSWERRSSISTMSFGHGIAVTPLHLANAVSSLLGDGMLGVPRLTVAEDDGIENAGIENAGIENAGVEEKAIVSEATIIKLRNLFRLNVLHGSGRSANVSGYIVGGKTGTADKPKRGGGYARNKLIANFIAAFPMDSPRYLVFVLVDEPHSRDNLRPTGGVVAAPLAGRVIERIAPVLGVFPDEAREALMDEYLPLPPPREEKQKDVGQITSTAF